VKVAENGGPGGCFRRPFHQGPTRRLAAFTFFRLQRAKRSGSLQRRPLLTFSTSTLTHPPLSPLPQRDLFWLHELCPQNGPLSIYPAHHGSRHITNQPSPSPPYPSLPSKLRRLLSFQRDAGFKSRTYHHCGHALFLLVHTGPNPCPVRKHWRDGRNFKRLVGLHRIINLRGRRSSQQSRGSGIST